MHYAPAMITSVITNEAESCMLSFSACLCADTTVLLLD